MKKKVSISLLVAIIAAVYAAGEVKIVRTVPKSAQNTVEATWSKPTPKPAKITGAGKTQFSGRLSLGGSGGINTSGKQLYDFFSDSHFLLIQPLDAMGNLAFSGKAFRKNIINGMNQNYLAKVTLSMEKLHFSSGITYTEKQNIVEQLNTDEINTIINASLNMSYIETFPIALSYTHKILQKKEGQEQPTTLTEDNFGDFATFKMLGNIGGFNLSISSNFDNRVDNTKKMTNTGLFSALSVTSPLISFVKVEASLSPTITTVRYTETQNETSSTTLDSGIGLIFPLSQSITLTTRGGRIDSWINQRGTDVGTYKPYVYAWKASSDLEYKSDSGLSAKTEYRLKSTESNFTHQASISGGFYPAGQQTGSLSTSDGKTNKLSTASTEWLEKVTLKGTLDQEFDSSWKLNNNKLSWTTDIGINPMKKMNVSGKYSGSMIGITGYDWLNAGSVSFKHQPDPMLLYGVGAGLKSLIYSNNASSLTQNYSANLTLTPQWNLRVYTFGIGEVLSLIDSKNQDTGSAFSTSSRQILSKLSYDMGIPILAFLQTRYHLTWEWLNGETTQVTTNTTSGNNFQHIFGLTISGKPIPFTLTTTYALSHGTRGIRHDLNSTLNFPFGKSFSLEGRFSLSYYKENESEKLPFLAGLNLAYEF